MFQRYQNKRVYFDVARVGSTVEELEALRVELERLGSEATWRLSSGGDVSFEVDQHWVAKAGGYVVVGPRGMSAISAEQLEEHYERAIETGGVHAGDEAA